MVSWLPIFPNSHKATTTTTITTDTTTTVTTTSSIATSTVPTPAGFTPIASEPGYVPKKRFIEAGAAPAIHGRRIEERVQKARNHICPPVGNPGAFSKYPQKVTCGALVVAKTTSTKTYTATSTATTTLPPATSTVTVSFNNPSLLMMCTTYENEKISHAFHSLLLLRPKLPPPPPPQPVRPSQLPSPLLQQRPFLRLPLLPPHKPTQSSKPPRPFMPPAMPTMS